MKSLRPSLRILAVAFVLLASTLAHAAASTNRPIIALWPNGAPGSEARRTEPEKMVGSNVSNIHQPTLTVYLPAPALATGCAIIVVPGGGHARLAIEHEGYNVGQWLADQGIAAFVLKHRLAKDDATPTRHPAVLLFLSSLAWLAEAAPLTSPAPHATTPLRPHAHAL